MEYCELGDLKDHVEEHGQLGEDQTQDIGWQILQGLRFMHHNNFAHRDLKPAVRPPLQFLCLCADGDSFH
jgi:serine/threonine protein kinase